MPISPDLLNSIQKGKYILFLGAGMSATSGCPLSKELIDRIINKYPQLYDLLSGSNVLAEAVQKCPDSEDSIKECVADALSSQKREISTEYRLLALLAKKLPCEIYTLNYDLNIERALDGFGPEQYNKCYYDSDTINNGRATVIKMAGDILNVDRMLFNVKEMSTIPSLNAGQRLQRRIDDKIPIIFIGYSFRDQFLYQMFLKLYDKQNVYFVGTQMECRQFAQHISNTAKSFFCELFQKLQLSYNVAHIKFDGNSFGGIETYITNIVQAFNQSQSNISFEHSFHNIYSIGRNIVGKKENFGFPLIKGSAAIALYSAAGLKKYDLFHCHDFISAYHAQQLGLPVVLTSHSLSSKDIISTSDYFNRKNELAHIEEMYYPMIKNIITLSDSHRDELPSFSNLHAKKLSVPFDFETLNTIASKITKSDARKELGFAYDDVVLLYIGRNDVRKGFQFLFQAFENIKKHPYAKNIKLLLVMPGITKDDNGEICILGASTASGSSVPNNNEIRFVTNNIDDIYNKCTNWNTCVMGDGMHTNESISSEFSEHYKRILEYYKAADLVVIPSLYEPFGYVALEALTCKCPILANNVGGLVEILKDSNEEYATFCSLHTNTYNPYDVNQSRKLEYGILSVLEFANGRCRIKDKVLEKAERGYSHVLGKYGNTEQQAKDLHSIYLQSIINSSDLSQSIYSGNQQDIISNCDRLCNTIIDYYLKDAHDIAAIVKRTGLVYIDLIYLKAKIQKSIERDNNAHRPSLEAENYRLFWDIAAKILEVKSNIPSIALMDTRTLAETITEITRSQIKNLRPKLLKQGWNNLISNDLSAILSLYNERETEENWFDYNFKHNPQSPEIKAVGQHLDKTIMGIINNMIRVDETDFLFGVEDGMTKNESDIKQVKVHLSTYYICKYPVTQREWNEIMGINTSDFSTLDCPAYNISYNECLEFVKRLNNKISTSSMKFDIPTEYQWECAAKCCTDNYIYSGSDNLLDVGWFIGNCDSNSIVPKEVGLLKPNRWGLYDMSGNVQEYCKDVYSVFLHPKDFINPCNEETETNKDHITRGGSILKTANCCRVTNRYDRYHADCKGDGKSFLGLRLVLHP